MDTKLSPIFLKNIKHGKCTGRAGDWNANHKGHNMCSDKEAYDMYKEQLSREDNLINNRLSWMLTIQGLLFAALSILTKKNDGVQALFETLKTVIPIVGGISALSVFVTVIIAHVSLYYLHKEWLLHHRSIKPSPFGLQKEGGHHFWNMVSPSVLLPFALMVTWVYVNCKI